MRQIASSHPGTGAGTLASAMQMWQWTLDYLQTATDPAGGKLYHGQRQGVTFPWPTHSVGWWPRARRFSTCSNLKPRAVTTPSPAKAWKAPCSFLSDLCHTQAAAAAGEVSRICTELVFGYQIGGAPGIEDFLDRRTKSP